MDPFALTGPSFLVFYILFGFSINFLFRIFIQSQGKALNVSASELTKDPYKIAYLRAGKIEAVAVTTVSLHDRGLLVWNKDKLKTDNAASVQLVKRPIERAILRYYLTPNVPKANFYSFELDAACKTYKDSLSTYGLLVNSSMLMQRFFIFVIALFLLIGCSWKKITIALSHGHNNILFLILLTLTFSALAFFQLVQRKTSAGDALISHLKQLFYLLKVRANNLVAGGTTNEAALVSAVFGLSVLSISQFPFIKKLQPVSKTDGSSCGSSSCGSSSCSSCGGGGCGGCGS
jgi:uncharacterized protein (TIGR04222 family)